MLDADLFALSPEGKTGYAGGKDLAKIDMESHRIVALKKGFLQGRAASVSSSRRTGPSSS